MYVTYTVPSLSSTFKAEEVDSLPILLCAFWTSGFFSPSRLLLNVNVYFGDGGRNVGKGFSRSVFSREQDRALNRIVRKDEQENNWNGSKKLLFTNPYN